MKKGKDLAITYFQNNSFKIPLDPALPRYINIYIGEELFSVNMPLKHKSYETLGEDEWHDIPVVIIDGNEIHNTSEFWKWIVDNAHLNYHDFAMAWEEGKVGRDRTTIAKGVKM